MNVLATKLKKQSRQLRRRGFTLIELVMVLVILTALAALVVPIVDYIRRQSDKTQGAFAIEQMTENISLYRTLTGNYPDKHDSLIASGGGAIYPLLRESDFLVISTLANDSQRDSLTKTGIKIVMDHDDSLAYRGIPGNSGTVQRPVANSGEIAVVDFSDSQGAQILASLYPQYVATWTAGAPTFVPGNATSNPPTPGVVVASHQIVLADGTTAKLAVFGVGPSTTSIGQTMVAPPAYRGVDGLKDYNRFLAVYAVYDRTTSTGGTSAKRAQLKGVLDTKGDFLNQELNEIDESNVQ